MPRSMEDRGTLVVRKIINLTDENIWVYNTLGSLVELKSEGARKEEFLKAPLKGTYYAVNEEVAESFKDTKGIEEKLIIPIYVGEGRTNERIYHFRLFAAEKFLTVELDK
ncbi:hypothetical protein IJJ53_03825 [Candidatus Saccharibacteria bacterium]|nr:hypothetical protein [Candidatus Saccharibacteria bacterium]